MTPSHPSSSEPEAIQAAFRALADPTRRQILVLLSDGDMTIAQVAERFDMTRAAVKKHLTVLEQGQLISVRPEGRERINRLEPAALQSAADWLGYFSHYWDVRLSNLEKAVARETAETQRRNSGDEST